MLLSAVGTEPQHGNCALLLRALRMLMVNTSYHQLSNKYLSNITEVLEKMATHKGWIFCSTYLFIYLLVCLLVCLLV